MRACSFCLGTAEQQSPQTLMETQSLAESVLICSMSFPASAVWAGDLTPCTASAWDKGSLFLL